MLNQASNSFTLLPASPRLPITVSTCSIASSSASSWLASGHPKLNCGRMFLKHPAAVLITANRARRWR